MRALTLVMILVSAVSYSQSIRFQGFVKDTKGQPLEMANVLAVSQATGETEAYSITGEKGQFSLTLRADASYKIQVSFIGFSPLEIDLKTEKHDVAHEFKLEEGIELQGIEIVHEMPVSVKGDTIVYNSDSFTNGTERKLGDILKKLPGIEVDSEGNVMAEGKPVSKLMVEGKEFFEGDTKLGTQNIPADAVDKIEVLKNYNEISQLKNVEDNSDNVAMNIKLKEGKKNFWFGELNGGVGPEERYVANPKLFYYSPDYSLNFINNFNNIGDVPFTFMDYFKFSGGLRNLMKKGGTNFNVDPMAEIGMMMKNDKAKSLETRFGAANFNFNPSKSWSISGFGILSSTDTNTETNTRTAILDTETGATETLQLSENKTRQEARSALAKFSATYKPDKNLQVDYESFIKSSDLSDRSSLATVVSPQTEQSQQIEERSSVKPFSASNNLNVYHTANEKNIFALELQHLYQEQDPFYGANLARAPFILDGYTDGQQRSRLNQERFVKTNKFDARLDYYYTLSAQKHLNFTAGNTYSYQNFNSHIFQVLDNGSSNHLNAPTENNDVSYVFNDAYLGVHFKFLTGKFTFNPGVTLHQYKMENVQLGSRFTNRFTRLLPDLNVIYDVGKQKSLSYNFSLVNDFTDINRLAEGSIFTNYNALYNGNRTLENALSQKHTLRYNFFNMYNMENGYASLQYTKVSDAVNTAASFDGINSTARPFNSNFANQSFDAQFNYGRSFFTHYKASAGGAFGWSRYNNMQRNQQNGQLVESAVESFTQNYNASFTTNFDNWPSLSLGYAISINDYLNDTFYTDSPFARVEYYFLNALTFKADYQYNHYTNKSGSVNNEYDFLNASLSYAKEGGKLEYRLGATNLFDTRVINDDSFNKFSTSTSAYKVQPRYVLLSLTYKI